MELSHRTIIAGSMAAALAIGAVTFAVRYHPPVAVAPVSSVPVPLADTAAAVADTSADTVGIPAPVESAPAAVAPIAAASAPIAPNAAAPTIVAPRTGAVSKSKDAAIPVAPEPKAASNRHSAAASSSTDSYGSTGMRAAPAIVASTKPEARASESIGGNTVEQPVMSATTAAPAMPTVVSPSSAVEVAAGNATLANSPVPAASPVVTLSAALPPSDSSITNEVKTQIAADSMGKDSAVGVSTTLGVVMLSGTLATQEAIDHVKDLAGKVKDVKSVDASGLKVATG